MSKKEPKITKIKKLKSKVREIKRIPKTLERLRKKSIEFLKELDNSEQITKI